MQLFTVKAIGTVHSPFIHPKGTPIQPIGAQGVKGTVELSPEYVPGLKDLDGFSHIILLYYFHLADDGPMIVTPYMEDKSRGIFSVRMPGRPNHIGLSVVRLLGIRDNILDIENVDILDGTPLLDIKPYVTAFDVYKTEKEGWLAPISNEAINKKCDGRFS
ncbi:MAG: tRNA (N6-threonylcarbamoyladenosine(37)-N6)-methyltransferase TrmO [Dehalococcoidales bacterium]|nr:tRNA (N6-threonylcarbamoyladenosine(37)-N6)-methyltransferase TrmO [Dehalococcoidales bacterium]MDX9986002.1 tRNA (N6-threonylcarbamoyladenosine(37)-N6)-methyltransferase TrmO [Dehalococcoidales bacterium]NLE90239.1 tRNA (N6-threonylcarbamoyladenosine(37)-N6)-methyltransferase TrmO [Dehalococcoidales bacterium]